MYVSHHQSTGCNSTHICASLCAGSRASQSSYSSASSLCQSCAALLRSSQRLFGAHRTLKSSPAQPPAAALFKSTSAPRPRFAACHASDMQICLMAHVYPVCTTGCDIGFHNARIALAWVLMTCRAADPLRVGSILVQNKTQLDLAFGQVGVGEVQQLPAGSSRCAPRHSCVRHSIHTSALLPDHRLEATPDIS